MVFKTYEFADKNSDGVLIVSEESEEDAIRRIKQILRFPDGWRLQRVAEEYDEL